MAPSATAAAFAPPPAAFPRVETLLGEAIAHLEAGRRRETLATIARLDRIDDVGPVAATLLGLVAMSAGARDLALLWLDRAIALDPGFIEALKGRATALCDCGRDAEADVAFERAFRAGCEDAAAHYHHGNVLRALGRRDDAIAAYDRALRLQPDYPEALRAGGAILRDSGQTEQALRFLDEALRLRPAFLDAIVDRANLLDARDRAAEALATLEAGLAHWPSHPQLLNNRGVVLSHLGRLDEAAACLDLAIAADASLAQAHLNKGEVEIRRGRLEAALPCFDAALALRPGYVEAYCAKGIALKLLGRIVAARIAFETALRHDPSSVYALANRGELALLLGDLEGGWPDYDARFSTRGHDRPVLARPVPEWSGEREPGRVVVFADQAAGDVIHFARYVPVLREAGADVTLVCRPKLQRLLRHVSEGVRVIATVPNDEAFAYQIPLSNMPMACRTSEADMPAAPYIMAEPGLVERWRARLAGRGFKVGLCWRGSQDWRSDPRRSVPLGSLRPLADIAGVRLVCLQMADNIGPDRAAFEAMRIETLGADLDDGPDAFVGTAAVMANLDLVVSCDTSIAHLAGALGRPTFVLLQTVPEWRFMLDREDSPWYPTMRLFRQVERDDWSHPVARLAEAVARLAQG